MHRCGTQGAQSPCQEQQRSLQDIEMKIMAGVFSCMLQNVCCMQEI